MNLKKKLFLYLICLLCCFLLSACHVFASNPNDFRITGTQFIESTQRGNSSFSTTCYLNYNSNTWFNGRAFWEIGNDLSTGFNCNYLGMYSYNQFVHTDQVGSVSYQVNISRLNNIVISLPHNEFCPIDKECRVDTILRFYSTCDNLPNSSAKDLCIIMNSSQISNVRANFQTIPSKNQCSYKSAYNGTTTDIAISCYSPKNEYLINIELGALQEFFTPFEYPNQYWYPVNFYLMYPYVTSGDTIEDLNTGGLDFFNSDYQIIVSNSYTKFNTFNLNSTTISNLVLLPVNMLRKFLTSFNPTNSDFCPSFHLGNWFGTDIYIPCISLSEYLGSLWNTIDIIFSAYVVYRLSKTMITAFNNFTILKEDMSEVWK